MERVIREVIAKCDYENPQQKLIAIYIAIEQGKASSGYATLPHSLVAKAACLRSHNSACRVLRKMEELGLVEVVRQSGRRAQNSYRVIL